LASHPGASYRSFWPTANAPNPFSRRALPVATREARTSQARDRSRAHHHPPAERLCDPVALRHTSHRVNLAAQVEQTPHVGVAQAAPNNLATTKRLVRAPGKVFVLKHRDKSPSRRVLCHALMATALVAVPASASIRPASVNPHHGQTRNDGKQSHHLVPTSDAAAWRHNVHQRRNVRKKLFALAGLSEQHVKSSAQSGLSFELAGIASMYSDKDTASGERMDPEAMTAAHRTLPFGTEVTVVSRQ
jgi:hypothetical protein